MQWKEVLQWAKKRLKENPPVGWEDLATPELDAELLLAAVLAVSRTDLIARGETELSPTAWKRFQSLVERRKKAEPLSYILKYKEFFGISLEVSPGVLIPRPETEFLVEKTISLLSAFPEGTLIDMGTGSGAIALAFRKALPPSWRIHAVDVSSTALRIARRNARVFQDHGPLTFHRSDLFQTFRLSGKDRPPLCILANLPYLPALLPLPPSVGEHEPPTALFSGKDGFDCYRRFFSELAKGIPGSHKERTEFFLCAFEFHPPQRKLVELMKDFFPNHNLDFFPDLAGNLRFGIFLKKSK